MLPKINKFKSTKDGYLAWQKLYKHYYARGNVHSYAKSCLEQLMKLSLTASSVGGVDTYISKFEDLCLKLEECGNSLL